MEKVKAKKHLGQHFLNDKNIAKKIVDSLSGWGNYSVVLEIGPGMGVLSDFLISENKYSTFFLDVDKESVDYLKKKYPNQLENIIQQDFLKADLAGFSNQESIAVIGNFPYNISTQIMFKTLEDVRLVSELVGMFQKEVAERLCSKPGNKTYGILSVLLQTYYEMEYLFTVNENVFTPPPKVKSGVIRLKRKEQLPEVDYLKLKELVKAAFNQRRKTMRNSLKSFLNEENKKLPIFDKRPEQLGWEEFVQLTKLLQQ